MNDGRGENPLLFYVDNVGKSVENISAEKRGYFVAIIKEFLSFIPGKFFGPYGAVFPF